MFIIRDSSITPIAGEFAFGTSDDWESMVSGVYTITHTLGYDTAFAENYDMRVKDCDYKHSVEVNTDYTFSKAPTTSLSVYDKSPDSVSPLAVGGVLYDFGELVTGGLKIRAIGHAGDTIRILKRLPLCCRYSGKRSFDHGCDRHRLPLSL